MLKQQLSEYFAAHRQELVEDISALVRIRSDRQDPLPGKPYGEGPAAALAEAMAIASRHGFAVKNYDNYVCAVDFSDAETQLDILAHLDVVPVGNGWRVTEPFQPLEKDGRLYGRGTADDKGPAMAALYAMKAIKDLGIPLKKNVRLILGTDEECGSSDIAYYYQKEKEAPCTFSPDAEFPVINTEKGSLQAFFKGSYEPTEAGDAPRLVAVDAGTKINVVPDRCAALVAGLTADDCDKFCQNVAASTGASFFLSELEDGQVQIVAKGVSAHASTPEKGCNAITAMLTLLTTMPFEGEGFRQLCGLASLFPHGDGEGKAAGIAMGDEISGPLTITLDILHWDEQHFEAAADCRASLCATHENLVEPLRAAAAQRGFQMDESCHLNPPHHVPADSPFVQTLLRVYEEYTGQHGDPIAIGGGTYAHHLQNGVAFGCTFPWSADSHMHGDDEFVDLEELLLCAQMFAQVIVEICG